MRTFCSSEAVRNTTASNCQVAYLREVELKGVVRAQADIQADLKEVRERVPFVCQEQCVVAQRTHCEANLLQIEQVLQRGHLPQQDAVRYGVSNEVGGCKMVGVSGFAAVRPEHECACGHSIRKEVGRGD